MDNKKFGKFVKELRKSKNMTQTDKNKHKKIIFIMIFIIILCICIIIYKFQLKQNENNQEEAKLVAENQYVKIPDRIIYKNDKNQFFIITPNENGFNTIYAEIANCIDFTIDGKVLETEEINEIKDNGRFIEFDYNTKSKNRIFPLDEENIAMINMLTEKGQISKINIADKTKLINKIKELTKGQKSHELNDYKSYNSVLTLTTIPTDLNYTEKVYGSIYQLVIDNEKLYENAINSTNFTTIKDMPQVDFDKENVIIMISKYDISSIEQSIGNIKYTFAIKNEKYKVNLLVVSELVNLNCIYCNVDSSMEKIEFERFYNESINNLDKNIFLSDIENYNLQDNEIKISQEQAKQIAQIGFEESAKRIAGEGADNVESEIVRIEKVSPNNYFIRYLYDEDKMYTDKKRNCYVVSRENEMGNGIMIYIDVTTGLIIGGQAYGD